MKIPSEPNAQKKMKTSRDKHPNWMRKQRMKSGKEKVFRQVGTEIVMPIAWGRHRMQSKSNARARVESRSSPSSRVQMNKQ
jgi:hypothetical protein